MERGYFWESEFDNVGRPDSFVFCQSLLGKRGWSDLLFMPNRGAEQAEHSAASNEKGESCLGGARQGRSDCGEEHTRPSPIFPEVD